MRLSHVLGNVVCGVRIMFAKHYLGLPKMYRFSFGVQVYGELPHNLRVLHSLKCVFHASESYPPPSYMYLKQYQPQESVDILLKTIRVYSS